MKRPGIILPAILALFILPFSAAFGQALSTGLLNYWNFEGNYNDTASAVVGSSSTVADNGTAPAGSVAFAAGPLGQYGNFTGPGYVDIPNSADVIAAGESLSMSVWFRVGAFDRSWQCLIAHGEGNDYRIARNGDNTNMAYAGGTGDITGGPAVNDSQWHHVVAITESAVSTRLWIDGTLVATGGVPTLTNNGAAQMMIGGNPNDAGGAYRSWHGDIDDVGMWSRALTPAEIGTIYTQGRLGIQLSALLVPTDTDGDGLPNAWETLYGLDPNSGAGVNGATGDPDADGLTNAQELNDSHTAPNDADSDDDGLTDGAEFNTHHTNPLIADTDGDGLSDGAEVNTHHSNPLLTDTDGDGMTDSREVAGGTNPSVADTGFGFGLVAYWPLDSDFNSTVNGITATPNGATAIPLVAGKFGKAIQLNGNDQFLQADGDENIFDFTGGQSMTVSAWFTADVIDTDWQCLVAKGDASGHWRMHRRGGDQPPEMSFCGGSADVPKHSIPFTVGTNTMHHVVGVSELGKEVRLYMDGVLISTGPAPAFTDSVNPMKIGANPDTSPGRFWEGKIDDVAFWRRALSTTEVQQLWNGGAGTAVGDLLGPPVLFQITQVNFNQLTNQWTLAWSSKPGRTYTLRYGTDLLNFGNDIDDSIVSQGSTTNFGPFPHPIPASGTRLFFKVDEN